MILNTWILGLVVGQITILFVFLFSAINAVGIYLKWDFESCDELQYTLEKRTYLVSALMKYAFIIHIFLFVLTVMALDEIAPLFKGAMCPVGVLSSNDFGFPFIYLKMVAVFIYSTWLVINHVDGKLENYPLVNLKYVFLIIIIPTVVLETVLLFLFVLNLNPEVITSCCGSVFSEGNPGIPGLMTSIPGPLILILLFAFAISIVIRHFFINNSLEQRPGIGIMDVVSWIVFFCLAVLAVIGFISIYIYEMPTHKCPFCFLKSEYNFIGYPLYAFLFLATASGLNKGVLEWLKMSGPLSQSILSLQIKLGRISIISMMGFLIVGFLPFIFYYLRTGRLI